MMSTVAGGKLGGPPRQTGRRLARKLTLAGFWGSAVAGLNRPFDASKLNNLKVILFRSVPSTHWT